MNFPCKDIAGKHTFDVVLVITINNTLIARSLVLQHLLLCQSKCLIHLLYKSLCFFICHSL